MKVRTDFVTNSSSSSFTAIRIESKKLAGLLSECVGKEAMENLQLIADVDSGVIHTSGKDRDLGIDDIWIEMTTSVPDSIDKVIPKLSEAVEHYIELYGKYTLENDDEERWNAFTDRLRKMKKDLTKSIEKVSWESGESAWGEFSTGVGIPFLREYGEEKREILESIAEDTFLYGDDDVDEDEFYDNLDRYIAEVTDEMVEEYIEGSPIGTSVKYEFNRASGIDSKTTEFEMY